jgi:hypothetical protein
LRQDLARLPLPVAWEDAPRLVWLEDVDQRWAREAEQPCPMRSFRRHYRIRS